VNAIGYFCIAALLFPYWAITWTRNDRASGERLWEGGFLILLAFWAALFWPLAIPTRLLFSTAERVGPTVERWWDRLTAPPAKERRAMSPPPDPYLVAAVAEVDTLLAPKWGKTP
jgi:hypothetical protein